MIESEQDLGSAIESESSENVSDVNASNELSQAVPDAAYRAQSELRVHELLALLACFVFPALGGWLLHAIRSQLSRPSEGIISDYNLTIFLLASEVRPLTHLIKLVQRRTLFLQRTISAAAVQKTNKLNPKIADMTKRLEELESRVSDSVMISTKAEAGTPSQTEELISKASTQANNDLRKTLQPEIDALSRAMRRYEKKNMTSAIQVETRLQELEGRVQDVVIIAAATQRNADKQAGRYTAILANWISACVVVPVQYAIYLLTLPQRMLIAFARWAKRRLGIATGPPKGQKGKSTTRLDQPRRKNSKERVKSG